MNAEPLNSDDVPFESFDSTVTIRFKAVLKRPLGYERGSPDEQRRHGETERYFETHDELVYEERLGTSILNIDAYFDPDYTYDYPRQIEQGDVTVTRLTTDTFDFDVYCDELIDAARIRAQEDSTEPSFVLAEWLHRAVSSSNVSSTDAGIFYNALATFVREYNVDTEWRLELGGGKDSQRVTPDRESPKTLEEARIYTTTDGDMEAVEEHREQLVEEAIEDTREEQ